MLINNYNKKVSFKTNEAFFISNQLSASSILLSTTSYHKTIKAGKNPCLSLILQILTFIIIITKLPKAHI